ncbi:CDP-alcohol phosphatidyltransferase family protein [Actinoplanes sp. NEAU-A12]|uniref:CDP-alcohol phosphatidyltransferase family protein n=1 Tax=Actinoplanes sandaracinus TaxID=3045177 RepID=A0ABT6WNL3_9ACTN|nr:CDP-alcohol phosphatidyltransferase family protein [Actinoplanes sandaracinus]MDI6101296.1 CDP-alcohol phosphatidyltransferase family protein [Actinoplanes sandaracinus]
MTAHTVLPGGSAARSRPRARDFERHMRGGGLLTVAMSQRLGARLCVPAHRLGMRPSALTIANLVCGTGGSALAVLGGPRLSTGIAAVLLWQLAYCFDCADGQLARYTGRTSEAGARLDVMCDLAVHAAVVIAIVVSTAWYVPTAPHWLASAFSCAVMINLCASALATSGPAAGSLFTDNNRAVVRAGGLLFDYPVFLTAYAGFLTFLPGHLDRFLLGVLTANLLFLAVRLGKAANVSLRWQRCPDRTADPAGSQPRR